MVPELTKHCGRPGDIDRDNPPVTTLKAPELLSIDPLPPNPRHPLWHAVCPTLLSWGNPGR